MKRVLMPLAWFAFLFATPFLWRAVLYASHPSPQTVPFPLKGYVLVNERDELAWYRVALPENKWTKIADGSFMLDQEYGLVQRGAEYSLQKTINGRVHSVDVRTGKETVSSGLVASMEPAKGTWKFGKWEIEFDGSGWAISVGGRKRSIPRSLTAVGTDPYTAPWSVRDERHVLFVRSTQPTSTSIRFELIMVDSLTGKSTLVKSVPEDNVHFISDAAKKRIFFLNGNSVLESWTWSGDHFLQSGSWKIPGTVPGEWYGSLFTVLGEWVLYSTWKEPGMFQAPEPRYYAFSTRTGSLALVMKPPNGKRGEAVAWLSR